MWKNLEPRVIRQRLIIEGLTESVLEKEVIKQFLQDLSHFLDMKVMVEPVGRSDYPGGGCAYWIQWHSSGAHFYSYISAPNEDHSSNLEYPLFTLDTYTCKPFSVREAVDFVREYFNPVDIAWKEIEV